MDGFRDRMNRGTSDRGAYDRYDRSRRGSFSAASGGISPDEVMQIIDDSNGKQLDVIQDFFEYAKEDKAAADKQILSAINGVMSAVSAKEPVQASAPVDSSKDSITEQILRTTSSNNDLLSQFAEEQLPMLVRGNSSILNQIRTSLDEKDEILREILNNTYSSPAAPAQPASDNEEVLAAAANNNALLNAIRSEIAGVQAEVRRTNERAVENEDAPLDSEDTFTKAQADELYKTMEENIHAECVKVYRNVQKVVEDQNAAIVNEVKGSIGGLKGITIVNLILLILNLAALLLRIFDFI